MLNILINSYLDLYCLINNFDEKGFLIAKRSSAQSLYSNKSKSRFTRNFFFFDIPNEDNKFNLSYNYKTNDNSEYLLSEDIGFFSLNRERNMNKIKFVRQDKVSNSSFSVSK